MIHQKGNVHWTHCYVDLELRKGSRLSGIVLRIFEILMIVNAMRVDELMPPKLCIMKREEE